VGCFSIIVPLCYAQKSSRFRNFSTGYRRGSVENPQTWARAITAEVSREERLRSEVIAVIDNPDTELSTVIRKNVEKAELDAYMKGILFTLGKK